MKICFKEILAVILFVVLFTSSVSTTATESYIRLDGISASAAIDFFNLEDTIITIDGYGYNAQEFMNRVLEYTIVSDPIDSVQVKDGSTIKFEYNESRQRTKKITKEGTISYTYDSFNKLQSELLPNGVYVEYSYNRKNGYEIAESITYKNVTYYYIVDDNSIITGLLDENHQIVCEYVYDKNGITEHIYEINGERKIKHQDNSGGDFVGCVNSLRYNGEYYDPETAMFSINDGSYYDINSNKMIGSNVTVDVKNLFGDQYDELRTKYDLSNENSTSTISSTAMQQLIYEATQYYTYGINEHTGAYSGNTWYTAFNSPSNHYKLAARIIYGENTYINSNSSLNTYLKYNRQGVGWQLVNRLLEDQYRYNNGKVRTFSSGTTAPTLYSILTYSGAFEALNSSNAKGSMNPSYEAYQQAFWIASCIKVCSNFEQ